MVITTALTDVLTVKLPGFFVCACSSFPNSCIFSFYGMHAGVVMIGLFSRGLTSCNSSNQRIEGVFYTQLQITRMHPS